MVVMEAPGTVTGMYRSVPSYRGGMNSEPSLREGEDRDEHDDDRRDDDELPERGGRTPPQAGRSW